MKHMCAWLVLTTTNYFFLQTHAVLRQAWLENIRPILLINKVDRLILELKLSPSEAHLHLQQLLEQANAVMAQLISGQIFQRSAVAATHEATNAEVRYCSL